jgi:hypothetical protein
MAPNIRDAERSRTSSCTFADRIAVIAIHEFHAHAEHALFKEHQTVLAAFLVHDTEADQLQVWCTPQSMNWKIFFINVTKSYTSVAAWTDAGLAYSMF